MGCPLTQVLIAGRYTLQLAGMVAEALDVTGTAHQTPIQGVTAFVWLICQLHPTVLTYIAINVEILVHGNYTNRLFSTLHWSDSLPTGRTLGCKHPMIIVNTIDFVVNIHSEGNTI